MSEMIAYCGLDCAECNAFKATQAKDSERKKQLAKQWTEGLKVEFRPEDINCDGCISDSLRIFGYCNVCEIRKCGREKKVKNCAYCHKYPCEKLSGLFSGYSKAKETLDEIRREVSIV